MDVKKFFSVDERFIEGKEEHGSVEFKEYNHTVPATNTAAAYDRYDITEVAITQDPYIDGMPPVFKALGVDADGNEYDITWEVVDNWEEIAEHGDDQLLVEDWEKPVSVNKI